MPVMNPFPIGRISTVRMLYTVVVVVIALVGITAACSSESDEITASDLRVKLVSMRVDTALDTGTPHPPELVELGQALFFDPILSGNRDISCATCHHPDAASGDAIPVSIGTGGTGLAGARQLGASRNFIPRNATDLFNRGAPQWHTMFWDSRVERTFPGGIISPAGEDLPQGLTGLLVAQAMFPVTSRDEMLGGKDEFSSDGSGNELAEFDDEEQIWDALMDRILKIDRYVELFSAAFPQITTEELHFSHAAIALAAFQSDAFAFADSPWDRFMAGDDSAISADQIRGADIFFGERSCASCHSGPLFTDQNHYNIAAPQTGPGKEEAAPDDFGRFGVTFDFEDLYAFRTPPLRNVELTGPWFHSGSYTTLEDVVRHHLDPLKSLENYSDSTSSEASVGLYENSWSARQFSRSVVDETGASFAGEYTHVNTDEDRFDLIRRNLAPVLSDMPKLSDEQIRQVVAFLESLTDPAARDLSHLLPESVPSGLPVDR